MTRLRLALGLFVGAAALLALSAPDAALSQEKKKAPPKKKAPEPPATDPLAMKVAKGFKVELLYSVPRDDMGSWVAMCHDPKGRLIVSDQYGALYRVTPPVIGGNAAGTRVEKIPAEVGSAQGLLWAFDGLYVVVNSGNKSGLYKVTDSNNDDMPDKVEKLRDFTGHGGGGLGEHGPHAVLMHPDGKRITVVCGNQTQITKYDTTRVPPVWGEDHLLPRMPDGNNFMKGVMGPGGAIYNVSPDGKTWELYSVGFRNQYDAAYNKAGDLFTYDADMEWDFNTPWYRPTRVCLVSSGSEFGWRNGAGKYPPYYLDNLPGILNIGPGSPTGVCFGYGAKFPQKYHDAFFICDWSYGKLYAVHMKPNGSAYTAEAEEFVTGTPLPLTDLVINPVDGAMYFAIGGRRTKSGLYRVTYVGEDAKTEPVERRDAGITDAARKTRLDLEDMHKSVGAAAVAAAFKELDNADRYTRFAARVALEHQDVKLWDEKALTEKDPVKAIHSLLALARVSAPCPNHAKPGGEPANPVVRGKILAALNRVDFAKLADEQKLDLIRVYHVALNRFGAPTADERAAILAKFDAAFPAKSRYVDGELCQLLIYLQSPTVAAKTVALLADAPTQEEQIEYARALRASKVGWTPELRKSYFDWFLKAAGYRGGNSFVGFLKLIRDDAADTLTAAEKQTYQAILTADLRKVTPTEETPRPFVKAWKLDDLAPILEKGLAGGRDFDRGRKLFAAGKCFACHRFDNEGGSNGPDLTGAAGRFSPRDLLESTVDPSKEISDQYGAVEIRTFSGKLVVGRIVNLNNNEIQINTNMLDPGNNTKVDRNDVETMKASKTSMMPAGLMDTFKEDEVLDLMAYLLSRGNRTDKMFKK